ncbi:hypothetical protein F4777DRAFT_552967 [Nemania sp. FL0916]|nr:hypothetical protein F4777DRAFT_552967 [Nemania sp. FL0916]
MSVDKTSWNHLPAEIRIEILGIVPALGGRFSLLARVARDWHSIVEPLNFAEISLTAPRVAAFGSLAILYQKRSLIRYIWFRVELKQYDCRLCSDHDADGWGLELIDNQIIVDAFENLFTTLSAWEPRGDLVLDISVYSPSDNQHWFKHLSFCSDSNLGVWSSRRGHEQGTTLINDRAHGWVAGQQVIAPCGLAIERLFDEIMGEGPFGAQVPEMEWWRSLPELPVVGAVLLRQQTRRQWKPDALANMLTRFPNMKELCYEPWRQWDDEKKTQTDECNQTLIESLAQMKLCKLTIFENFNESYFERYFESDGIRVPNRAVSRKLARASLRLATLSASFMVDAGYFFAAHRDSWTWDKLTSLALTSRILANDAGTAWSINIMLQKAAAVALKMPRLVTMELWNGRRGVAMLFRYHRARDGQSATITVRGTWVLALRTATTQAWDAVADRHRHGSVVVQTSLIDPDVIRCHGDAIQQLGLSTEVTRPISLRQILKEHEFEQ